MDFGGGGGAGIITGNNLEAIEAEQLAFQSASGDENLRLLPNPWPLDNLPPTTSSLLSVASSKGILAAAGPDALVVTSTESVRRSFLNDAADPGTKVKNFAPQATIQIPRVSQVAFSSDESCLVIAAEQGGGLAVYDTNALGSGNATPAFELPTEGQSVRQLLPNPNPSQDGSKYFGIITSEGKLLLADLKERRLVTNNSGSTILYENVSCGCWSRLGKQIVVGLADGTAAQLDPSGNVKAQIAQPPRLAELRQPASNALPVTSIYWVETNDFLVIHTPINPPNSGADDDSIYHLVHREKSGASFAWTYFQLVDPCPPFGPERKPAHHFVQRLREWANLSEMIVLASTASTDIGIFTKSKAPLSERPKVTDIFTTTSPPEGRRAAMPMINNNDTSPIGMAFDMSATEKIQRPIPMDETIDESPVPLPALYVLSNEGILSMWWIVYNESVRQISPYPDLIAAGGPRSLEAKKSTEVASPGTQVQPMSPMRPPSSTSVFGTLGQTSSTPSQGPAFGQSTFGQTSSTPSQTPAFGQPSSTPTQAPAFGQSSFGQSSFGKPSTPGFGGTSTLGIRQSPWGGSGSTGGGSQFGKSTFGQPTTFGQPSNSGQQPVFGQPSAFGQTSNSGQQPAFGASGFGQVGGMGANKGSVWGTPSQQPNQTSLPTGSGSVFGGNASNQSPFMSVGGNTGSASGFAALGGGDKNKPTPSIFGEKKPSLPADPSGSTISFGNNTSFGSGSTAFGVRSGFGSSDNASTFGKPSVPPSREESMDDDTGTSDTTSTARPPTVTSKSPLDLGAGGFKLGSTFKGDGSAKDDLPKPKDPGAGLFGTGFIDTLGDTSKTSGTSEGAAWLSGGSTPSSAAVKKEPDSEDDAPKLKDIPPAAPPEKEDEQSAPVDDAPLPPDPATWKPKPGALPAPIPPGFGLDFGKAKETKDAAQANASLRPASGSSKQDEKGAEEVLVAGSPPIDLGKDKFSEGVQSDAEDQGPPEDDEDWSDDDGEGEGEEEDEDEEEEENTEEQGTPEITDPKGLSAFESRLTPASPKRGEAKSPGQNQSTTPATDKTESYTPAGLPPAPVMFAPPHRRGPHSPRSPSPVRSATSPLRPLPTFGSSQPLSATQPSQSSLRLPSSQGPFAQSQPPQRIAVPPAQLLPKQPERPAPPSKPSEPDAGSLEDEEDARIQSILSAPIEPTKDVPAFLAHQDYVANGDEKSGLAGQIERVFRDINSMIDTLALNARSLQGFMAGNMRPNDAKQKDRFDLEDEESWVIDDASELSRVVDGVEIELEDGKLHDVRGALETLREEEKELAKLRAKSADARKRIQAKRDPEQLSQQANATLPVETQTLQAELRQGTQKVQTLMSKAEELLSVLRAELASQPQSKGKSANGVNGAGMPSVEAVEKTILKMTRMIEERSGDVDVLEAKLRKLSPDALKALKVLSAVDGADVDDLAATLKATQISKSTSGAAALRASRVSAYGSPVAARRSRREGTPGTADSLAWKGSLMDVSNEEIEAYRLKKDARRRAMDRLRETLESRGPRVVRVGEA